MWLSASTSFLFSCLSVFPTLKPATKASSSKFDARNFSEVKVWEKISALILCFSECCHWKKIDILNPVRSKPATDVPRAILRACWSLSRLRSSSSRSKRFCNARLCWIKSCSVWLRSFRRCFSFSCARANAAPRNNTPSSRLRCFHWYILLRSCSCQARKLRSVSIHCRSSPQLRISASWATSTVSCSAALRLVTTNRASANFLTNTQFSEVNSAFVANRRVSSVPSPGHTNWIKICRTCSCCVGLSLR